MTDPAPPGTRVPDSSTSNHAEGGAPSGAPAKLHAKTRPTRSQQYFRTDDLQHRLGQKTARGGAYTLGSIGINFVVTTVSTVLITRNLTDEDFGLFGMVMVLTGFASMFVDLGLSRAVIQKPQVNHAQVSTLFWINLAVAALLAGIVAAATPLLVWFYDEPRLAPINLALAGLFIVSALGLQHRALLTRRLEHGRLNLVSLLATPIAAVVAVVIAYLGGKVWALVALPAVAQLVTVIGMWVACPWVPGLPRRHSGVRTMLGFGAHVTGFQFVNYFARNADNAMLGFAWGAGPLGLYTRAYSLMMLPASKLNTPLTNVVVPALSRLVDQPDRYRRTYRLAISLSANITTPAIAWLLVICPEAVPLLLGEQWAELPLILLSLTGAALHAATNGAGGWIYLSLGRVDRMLRWSCYAIVITIIAMAIGIQYGAIGVAIAVSLSQILIKFPGFLYATSGTFLKLSDLLIPITFPTLTSIVAGAVAFGGNHLATHFIDFMAEIGWQPIVSKSIIFILVYCLSLRLTPLGRSVLASIKTARTILLAR